MTAPALYSIRACLEGVVPSLVATCAPDGVPNVTYVSQVHYVDRNHVALSFQFFNKTRENILANPRATAFLLDPHTGGRWILQMHYLRTETEGGLFERMKAHLAGIASHTGMAGVFKLQGADVYEVLAMEHLPGAELAPAPDRTGLLAAVRSVSSLLASASDLHTILDDVLALLETELGVTHAMVMLIDRGHNRLFTVASRGYATSGVGSEIAVGHGVIGVAAREGTSIRIMHATSEYTYSRTARERARSDGMGGLLETEIPLPGLPSPGSQLAVPLRVGGCTVGVLFVESPLEARFSWEDEDALMAIAAQLGTTIVVLQQAAEASEELPVDRQRTATPRGSPLAIRHYSADHSVFIGDDYLIKGVAGAIFRKLVRDYVSEGRTDFTNRELRLDSSIRLPDITDNLEARLILLARRLQERGSDIRIEKTGRGRFRLGVERPLTFVEVV